MGLTVGIHAVEVCRLGGGASEVEVGTTIKVEGSSVIVESGTGKSL